MMDSPGRSGSGNGLSGEKNAPSRSGSLKRSEIKQTEPALTPRMDKKPGGPEGTAGGETLEDSINLEVMLKLRQKFLEADADGGGDLDMEEFVEAFDGVMPAGSREELGKLFLRIDANSDGTVDWDEFASFMLLENAGAANMRESESILQFHRSNMPDKVPPELMHKSPLMQIINVPPGSGVGERYATAGQDGTIRMWNVRDLSHHKTIVNGSAWVTSLVYTPMSSKLAVSSFSRDIKLYDLVNTEICGSQTELDHAVYSMDCAVLDKSDFELMVTGDIGGCIGTLKLKPQDNVGMNSDISRENQFGFKRHWKEAIHTDWVSQVKYVPDLAGIIASSFDNTLSITDIEQRSPTRCMTGHTKGIHGFGWSSFYKFVASAGMDRKVMIWNPFSCKHIQILEGHMASVKSIVINERDNQIVSVDVNKTIKVWDIRNYKCIQTLQDEEIYQSAKTDNIISAMIFDKKKRWLVTGNAKLKTWPLRAVINKTSGAHTANVSCCLYSPNFEEVITADYDGTVCVWVMATGQLRFRFTKAHGSYRITSMTLDSNNRRLITGAENGELKMWNFSSGACIKTMLPKGIGQEVTGISYIKGRSFSNIILCAGWDRRITIFEDEDENFVSPLRQIGHRLPGHEGDILSLAVMSGSGDLATAGYEGHILIWNVDSGAIKRRLVPPGLALGDGAHGEMADGVAVERIKFMSKKLRHMLLSVSADRALRMWNALDGRLILEIDTNHRRGESIVSMACRKDNRFIATGDSGGWIKVWDCSELANMANEEQQIDAESAKAAVKEHACWQAHTAGAVADLVWIGTNEPFFVSTSSDTSVALWHKSGTKVGDFGKDEWNLQDKKWADLSSDAVMADPNEGLKDYIDIQEQLRRILNPGLSPSSSLKSSPNSSPRRSAYASSAASGSDYHTYDSSDEEPAENTTGVPTSLIIPPSKPVSRRLPKFPQALASVEKDSKGDMHHTPQGAVPSEKGSLLTTPARRASTYNRKHIKQSFAIGFGDFPKFSSMPRSTEGS